MTRLALLVAAAMMVIATLLYATHRREPEFRMADWDETDDGWFV